MSNESVAPVLQPPTRRAKDEASAAPHKEARRVAVLEAAARRLNAAGASGASFAGIARDLGLTRAALYYYVADRQDLVLQCYRRSCAVMADDLAAATAAPGSGLDRLAAYIRGALDPEREPPAVLSELDYLAGEACEEIAASHGANVAALRALIGAGVADGSIRPCDDEAVAQAIVGVISWVPLSLEWVEGAGSAYRPRMVEAVSQLISDGYATDPGFVFVPPVSIEAFFPPAPKPFDRAAQAEAKVEQLLMTASQIINRRGVDGASLDDITGALGATKGAFYHYLKNKTDLVVRCYRRAMRLNEAFAEASGRLGRTGLEKGLIGMYLNTQAQASGLAPMTQLVGAEALPPAFRREMRRRSRALHQQFTAYGLEGLADGSNRDVDLDAVALLGAGFFEWLPKWFDPADPRASGALADEYCRLSIAGLRRR
jgi:AcrR family transcriptional regulator